MRQDSPIESPGPDAWPTAKSSQFLIDHLQSPIAKDRAGAILELQLLLWQQDPSLENYGKALEAWVAYESIPVREVCHA